MPKKNNFEDLTNKKFNKLLVLGFSHRCNTKRKKVFWKCICDCGEIKSILGESLKNGNTKSCGCINSYKDNTASFNHLYSNYKNRAKLSKLKFDLNKKQFRFLTQQNCHYCGIKPSQILKQRKTSLPYVYNGIDRMDNSKGYTLENCLTCCKLCNNMKHKNDINKFLNQIKSIYKYSIENKPEMDDRDKRTNNV